MRYLMSARVKPGREGDLLRALEDGSFGRGFPYGDLGAVLAEGRVGQGGTIRWIEVCYCREYYGVAMEEELPYFEDMLTDIVIADARNPQGCKGYPECGDCTCTRGTQFEGERLVDHLRRMRRDAAGRCGGTTARPDELHGKPTRWTGWKGQVTPEEAARNAQECSMQCSSSAVGSEPSSGKGAGGSGPPRNR